MTTKLEVGAGSLKAAATAIANSIGGRRGVPPIANVLELLSPKLQDDCIEDADAALEAVALAELLDAANRAQCSCSVRERESGHRVDCWMPALAAAIEKAEGRA